ncbi:MAG: hypothetical protein KIT62_10075 [Cyclobacteriaceae bacterium]|nr:hypothetical protein [Cyclobacteriaceae bacterium]
MVVNQNDEPIYFNGGDKIEFSIYGLNEIQGSSIEIVIGEFRYPIREEHGSLIIRGYKNLKMTGIIMNPKKYDSVDVKILVFSVK